MQANIDLNQRFKSVKKVFNITADIRTGESFHITGSPRREVFAGYEGCLSSVTFMSIDDWGNESFDGAAAENADTLLSLLDQASEDVGSEPATVTALYPIHGGDNKGYNVDIGDHSKHCKTIQDVIAHLKSGDYMESVEPENDGYDMDRYY